MMRPLEGYRILDFSHAVAGPNCTYHLRLLGADVVKIERPELGDDLRHYTEHAGLDKMSAPFIAYNTGKRSMTLDLANPEARAVVARMIAQSDVLVENFRPGVARKLGLDCTSAQAINPRLVYCSIAGFGQTGDMRDWPAYDHIVQAMSGLMMMNGNPDQEPLKVGIPLADVFSGYMAAFAIMSALLQRERSGPQAPGQYIDISMLDALMTLMGSASVTHDLTGKSPPRVGNLGFRLVATSSVYKTRDGYIAIGANHHPQIKALFEILGVDLLADPRFATHKARIENATELRNRLAAIFIEKDAAELEPVLARAKVPVAKVRELGETVALSQLADRDLFVKARVPGLDRDVRTTGAGFRFAKDGPYTDGAAPMLGEHTDAILTDFGFASDEIAGLRERKIV